MEFSGIYILMSDHGVQWHTFISDTSEVQTHVLTLLKCVYANTHSYKLNLYERVFTLLKCVA